MPSWADHIKGFVNEYVVEIPDSKDTETKAPPVVATPAPTSGVNPLASAAAAAPAPVVFHPMAMPETVAKPEPPPAFVAKLREKVGAKQQLTTMLLSEINDGAEFFPGNEAGLFAFAFKKGKKNGMTAAALVQELDAQSGIVDNESTRFKAALDKQITEDVGTKQGALEGLGTQIQTARTQIAQLEASIKQLSEQQSTVQADINTTKAKAQSVQTGFDLAADLLRGEIAGIRSKVQTYLKD